MFHPVLPPQLPPNLESLKPFHHLASTAAVKVKTDEEKLIIEGHKYQSNSDLVRRNVSENKGCKFLPTYPKINGEVINQSQVLFPCTSVVLAHQPLQLIYRNRGGNFICLLVKRNLLYR